MRSGLLAIVIATLLSEPSTACVVPSSLSAEERARADSVFVGRVVRIDHPTQRGNGRRSDRAATITFDVIRTIRGRKVQGTIEVYGFSNTGNFPGSLEEFTAQYGFDVSVGILFPDTIKSHTSCSDEEWTTGSGRKLTVPYCRVDLPIVPNSYKPAEAPRVDHPRIIEKLCSGPFIRRSYPSEP